MFINILFILYLQQFISYIRTVGWLPPLLKRTFVIGGGNYLQQFPPKLRMVSSDFF